MGWSIKIKRGTRCDGCQELWTGGVWLVVSAGIYCSSECFQESQGDDGCEVREDGKCEELATATVREPYTPASFPIRCCAAHKRELLAFGYLAN